MNNTDELSKAKTTRILITGIVLGAIITALLIFGSSGLARAITAPTPTYTLYPTYTSYPTLTPYPTFTQVPTQTPNIIVVTATLTPTPVIPHWTTDQVISAFKSAGLVVENPRLMNKEDYGIAPVMADRGIRFLIPSLCADCGGRIMDFKDNANLLIDQGFYERLGKQNNLYFSWVFVRDNILVQINGDLKPEEATKYEQALKNMQQ